jgi:hypothetical protein
VHPDTVPLTVTFCTFAVASMPGESVATATFDEHVAPDGSSTALAAAAENPAAATAATRTAPPFATDLFIVPSRVISDIALADWRPY